jgi:hypothetical protein
MKCCIECFKDREIRDRFNSFNERGNCDFCGAHDKKVLDLDTMDSREIHDQNLAVDFENLTEQFTNDNSTDFLDQRHMLSDYLEKHTSIFSASISSEKIAKFLKCLLPQQYKENPALFDQPVIPTYLLNKDKMKKEGIFYGKTWKYFKYDIQHNNRFHSTMVNGEILADFFKDCSISLKDKKRLYRARISNNGVPLKPKDMWSAPFGLASPGRLNASGIGYLYLSEDIMVCLQEIKASVNDICTVATFEVETNDLKVVDLGQISNISIFTTPSLSRYLMNYDIFQDIDSAMIKTSQKNKSETEFVPTEFMSDLIKSTGADGIMYKSTLDASIEDVVLFDGSESNNSKIHQLDSEIKTYRITKSSYEKDLL